MVEQESALDSVFKALSDPTRRQLLAALGSGPRTVSDLAEPHAMSLAAVSKHLDMLERSGLIARQKRGRERICSLQLAPLAAAQGWLERNARFWSDRLDALEIALKEDEDDRL